MSDERSADVNVDIEVNPQNAKQPEPPVVSPPDEDDNTTNPPAHVDPPVEKASTDL